MDRVIKSKIEKLLSKEYYCRLEELNGKETIYSINTNIEQSYIKILAYRNCVVVCTSKNVYSQIRKLLQNKSRDEIFENPFVYGQTIHYVPNNDYTDDISALHYESEFLLDGDVLSLNGLMGFENSLAFDESGYTPTKAIYLARDNERIIGIAGAAKSSVEGVLEVGVDVLEEYRNARLGTHLVRRLTRELLLRDIVPFYSASITNIGSQMVANRCGYIPMWVDTFGTILDGSSVYNDIVKELALDS